MAMKSENPSMRGVKPVAFAVRHADAALHKPLTSLNLILFGL